MKLYEKLKKEGYKVMLDIAHGVIHAYLMIIMLPEAWKTIEKAVNFFEGI